MTTKYARTMPRILMAGGLLLIAFLLQFTKYLPWPAEVLTGLWTVRNAIQLTLMLMWCSSLRRRIVSTPVRRLLTAVTALMIFWLAVRMCKWEYTYSPEDALGRYCWYGYYVPMVLIPLLGVLIADHIGKPEGYHCPKWMVLLFIPAGLLILAVFTNDAHGLVFSFPQGIGAYNSDYRYGPLFYVTAGWFLLLGYHFVVMLLKKSRHPANRQLQRMPLIILVAAMVFWTLYSLGLQDCDLAAINCLLITALLETAIQGGLIPANSNYRGLFQLSTCPMQIVDEAGVCHYRSKTATDMQLRDILQARRRPVHQEDTVIYSRPVSGGHVLWRDDVRQINTLTGLLKERQAFLSLTNTFITEDTQLREKQWKIAEKTRLYNSVIHTTASQLEQVDYWLAEAKKDPTRRRQIMARICVLGAYIKRRGNLALLAEQGNTVLVKELEYCLWESLDNLRLGGVLTAINSTVSGKAKLENVCAVYDLFEEVVELLYGNITAVMLHLSSQKDMIRLRMQIGCAEPVSPELLSGLKVRNGSLALQLQDEDILLELQLPEGGGRL